MNDSESKKRCTLNHQRMPSATSVTATSAMPVTTTPKSEASRLFPTPIASPLDPTQRRSSRSIKRRRFDDEIVESSLKGFSIPVAAMGGKGTRTPTSSVAMASSYSAPVTNHSVPTSSLVAPASSPSSSMSPSPMPSVPSPALPALPPAPATPHSPASSVPSSQSSEKRRPAKSTRRKGKPKNNMSTKDLGRWKPTDDLALIIGVQQTNELRDVHLGVKFSCRFTLAEIQARWWALLYDESVSPVAVAAMRNLHPELIASVYSKALYSQSEEIILARVPSTSEPTLSTFQTLLDQHASVFLSSRTAKTLFTHWQLMKHYFLLPDQSEKSIQRGEQAASLSDAEDLIRDGDLQDPKDEALHHEMFLADRALKREINRLEVEVKHWAVAVEYVTGITSVEFDNQTLAVLKGRVVRYLMRSREISLGRKTKDLQVDVDLGLEGPAYKVSRRQGMIRLRNNGDFFLVCEGKRPIIVDGKPLLSGNKTRLNNNSVIEISCLRFIFLVNLELTAVIRSEAAKLNVQ